MSPPVAWLEARCSENLLLELLPCPGTHSNVARIGKFQRGSLKSLVAVQPEVLSWHHRNRIRNTLILIAVITMMVIAMMATDTEVVPIPSIVRVQGTQGEPSDAWAVVPTPSQ